MTIGLCDGNVVAAGARRSGAPSHVGGAVVGRSMADQLGCAGADRGWANAAGHWYYLRLDMTTHPSGYPSSTFQMQTRRYKDITQPSDWEFLSYQYYGD